jgi:hypothetical protein
VPRFVVTMTREMHQWRAGVLGRMARFSSASRSIVRVWVFCSVIASIPKRICCFEVLALFIEIDVPSPFMFSCRNSVMFKFYLE